MSIRMLVLTDAHDGTRFRIAAHTILSYHTTGLGFTKVNGHDVAETVEEIDRFFDIDRLALPAQEDFESDEPILHS